MDGRRIHGSGGAPVNGQWICRSSKLLHQWGGGLLNLFKTEEVRWSESSMVATKGKK
jgi:hypothetical protein